MADTKITGLTELTSATGDDLLVAVDAPGGTPVTKKITLTNLASSLRALSSGKIMLSAAGGWPSTTSGCASSTKTEYTTNDQDLYVLAFDKDTQEYAQWTVWMPDDWNAGTVTAEFCWSAASSSGDVIWGLQGISYANDDAIDAAWGTAQEVTDTLTATGDICYSSATAAITLAGGPAAGELVQFRAYRKAADGGDTLAADARLLAVKVSYTKT